MSLQGAPELRARLRAIRDVAKPVGRRWAVETSRAAKGMVPRRTGQLARSIRPGRTKGGTATFFRATVVAKYWAYFIDAGTKAHEIVPRTKQALKFTAGDKTIFARKASLRRHVGNDFRARSARLGLERTPMAQLLIDEWESGGRSAGIKTLTKGGFV